ncbi:DEKNAAC100752 [Brettanomyces naardenensis]|uniref:DEKNAAC100752 n=1 Tax=Brettanomyces naardenensis TaxID=13370 RepID=A0A448YFE7_BRENA|nr:DEKNAAC100752 [Brettanomyces naardenensis]
MKFSAFVLSAALATLASAAPILVTDFVTNIVTVTIAPGETQVLSDSPAATSASSYAQAVNAFTTSEAPAPVSTSDSSSAPASSSSDSSSAGLSGFASQILSEHNAKRALHGVPDLEWDDTLATYAQNYADQYDCSGSLVHSGGPYGEDLALGYSITGAVDAWYSEGDNYDYGACSVYDHFTQVIWKSTTQLGCGQKTCNSYYGTYIVCSYGPAGNIIGECSANVLPPV